MNNFEKRKFLDYLEKLLPVTDTNSYSFDGVFDFMLEEFKMDRKVFRLMRMESLIWNPLKKELILKRF